MVGNTAYQESFMLNSLDQQTGIFTREIFLQYAEVEHTSTFFCKTQELVKI
jgi:hypothetical protein